MNLRVSNHAGHNPDGKIACGSVGLIKESTEARKVAKLVNRYLKLAGCKVYNDTVNNGKSQDDVLNKLVAKINGHVVDLILSMHFNSGRKDNKGDNDTGGTEILLHDFNNKQLNKVAKNVVDEIAKLGYDFRSDDTTIKGMEGVKLRPELAVLRRTEGPAMLIECCFVDDRDDVNLYNAKKMAQAIVIGIINSYGVQTVKTKKKLNLFNKNGKIVGKIKKGTICNFDEYRFIKGKLMGHRKKLRKWVRVKYTKET